MPKETEFHEVTAAHPCPVCEKPDWCATKGAEGDPDVAYCMREPSDHPKGDGWIHPLKNESRDFPSTHSPKTSGNNGKRRCRQSRQTKNAKTYPTAREALQAQEAARGKAFATWVYHNANGEPIKLIARWNLPDGNKDIVPITLTTEGWIVGGKAPHSLYNLHLIRDASMVMVSEGEPAADALSSLGMVSTTSPHGSKSAAKSDWSPLAGKVVILWRDNDSPGEIYQRDVIAQLSKLNPQPTVSVILIDPKWGEKFDAADWLAEGGTREQLEQLIGDAEPVEMAPREEKLRYLPFPLDCFPTPIAEYVKVTAAAIGVDPAMIAVPLLAVLAVAIGNSRSIVVRFGWIEHAVLYLAIAGESGSGKTPSARKVLEPMRQRDSEAIKHNRLLIQQFQQDLAGYEVDLAAWKNARKRGSLEPAPEKPQYPPQERYTIQDATVEKMIEVLADNRRSLLSIRDELSGLFGAFDRYSKAGGAERAIYLSAWSGEPLILDRKTSASSYVDHPRLSIFGGVQPELFHRIIGDDDITAGLPARFLIALPPTPALRWSDKSVPDHVVATLADVVDQLYSLEPTYNEDTDTEKPVLLKVSKEGTKLFSKYVNENAELTDDAHGGLRAALAKLPAQAARLALVLHCSADACGEPTTGTISEGTMENAIRLAKWFGNEACRLYRLRGESEEEKEQRNLVEWIKRKGGSVTVREVQQGHREFATSDDAEIALKALVNAGFGVWDVESTRTNKKRIFRLSTPSTPTHSPNSRGTSESVDADWPIEPEPAPEPTPEPEPVAADWGTL